VKYKYIQHALFKTCENVGYLLEFIKQMQYSATATVELVKESVAYLVVGNITLIYSVLRSYYKKY
jgi:hypothetical protein